MNDQKEKNDMFTRLSDSTFDGIWIFCVRLFKSFKQCYYGYENNLMPFQKLVTLSVLISLFWTLQIDVTFLKLLHYSIPRISWPPPVGIFRLCIWFLTTLSPFLFWGWIRQTVEQDVLKHLRDTFESAGLKNNDKYPNLIREYITENGSRKLQLLSDGIVVDQYLEKIPVLENKLGVKIESIKQHQQLSKVIEIEIAEGVLPTMYGLDNILAFKDFTFPIGKTRTELIIGDLKKVPHYLFAGMTGKGKSTFIKTMISVLLANNKELEVKFIDLKGTEATEFDGHPRVNVITDIKISCDEIEAVDKILLDRQEKFKSSGVKDLVAYNEKMNRPESEEALLPRVLVVVDEIAQLTPSLSTEDHAAVKKANLLLNKISRMGRSFGIHLIVGVQKPDTRNLDSTVKANLEGILCFQVANRIQSQVVLDSNKAAYLNSIAGRAIWQVGGEDKTLQTPFITKEKIISLTKKEKNDRHNDEQRLAAEDVTGQGSSEVDKEDSKTENTFYEANRHEQSP